MHAPIQERAEVLVQMFETMCERLHAFVAADCPSSESQRLQQLWTSCLHYYARAFRGAQEWRDGCDEGVLERL